MTMSNPQSPFGPDGSEPGFGAAPRPRRPGGLTAICVIAIVLGSLGVLGALRTLASVAMQPAMEKSLAVQRQQGANEQAFKAAEQMQQKANELGKRYRGINGGMALVNLIVSACLLVGGIAVLKMSEKGRMLLLAVLAVAIVFDVVHLCVYIVQQLQMATVLAESMPEMMKASAPKGQQGAQQAAEMGATVAKGVMYLVIAVQVAFGLAKLIFYGVGARYLCKPRIRTLCGPSEADSF
jgi:hypothetical protein